jgi:hypothetical protein
MEIKTFEGNRTAFCCVNVRFADGGGTRAPMDEGRLDEGRSRPGADRGALSGIALALSDDTPISIGSVATRFCVPRLILQAEPASLASWRQGVAALQKFLYREQSQAGARASTLHRFVPAPN